MHKLCCNAALIKGILPMLSFRSFCYISATICMIAAISSPTLAVAQNKTFGDWTFICHKNKETKKKRCEIAQTQTMKDKDGKSKGRLLRLSIAHRDKNTSVVHALLPLGMSIPSGVVIVIDENKQRSMALQRCTSAGCEAALIVKNDFLKEMKKGKHAKIGFKVQEKTMVIKASLKGISQALRKLP